eukprot:CAMPEP_0179151690 /NCGR_PEP_ID=MMETSP0796-20121207/73660_1 /TAXON_ID=73915 /ORGANISM="Pyrodinium bahamense, Strain pbaha01" /LENGTH=46 /DNA_ID= /DNA_START= /DNA_END= /DNA_ORIENTATION=
MCTESTVPTKAAQMLRVKPANIMSANALSSACAEASADTQQAVKAT